MSLIFENKTEGPKMHVLLIGVGGYRYLKEGMEPIDQEFDVAKDLEQLTSPPVSVEALYKCIKELDDAGRWIVPLGSVQILLSKAPEGKEVFPGQDLITATIGNIQDEYEKWKKRCNEDSDNVAFFFFCGHGYEKDSLHLLLAEDFARSPLNPFSGAFCFTETRVGFQSCRAKTQLFFIDSCRGLTNDMLLNKFKANPLDPPSHTQTNCMYDLTQQSVARNKNAQGNRNSISHYTNSLIKALYGGISKKKDEGWVVSTSGICGEMNTLMGIMNPGNAGIEKCSTSYSDSIDLLRHPEPPQAEINIMCCPDEAHSAAGLQCSNLDTSDEYRREPEPLLQPWIFQGSAGMYRISAEFNDNSFSNHEAYYPVEPPFMKTKIYIK